MKFAKNELTFCKSQAKIEELSEKIKEDFKDVFKITLFDNWGDLVL